MGPSRTLGYIALFAAALVVGCDAPRSAEPPRDQIRAVNELSTAQLRAVLKGYDGDWRNQTPASRGAPPPAAKSIPPDSKRIPLPPIRDSKFGAMTIKDAITARRSTRDFSDTPLNLEELGFLLWACQGITVEAKTELGELVHFRAAPSAGALYPLETYIAAARVDGLAKGIYRYLPPAHELLLVREIPSVATELQKLCYGEAFVGQAAATFLWTAVPARTEWKYAFLSPRLIAVEAGHVAQNLYLAATASTLGACALMAYQQQQTDAWLGVDGIDEFTFYIATVGKLTAPHR
jgi:SagB-type dehydrogenase family enzyme